jgi:WD40 repeat protein
MDVEPKDSNAFVEGEKKEYNLNCVVVYGRSNFTTGRPSLILPGLKTPSWVVRFSPLRYAFQNPLHSELDREVPVVVLPYRLLFAVGTDDSLIIYDTQSSYPRAVLSNFHIYRYQDVDWSCDGSYLIGASHDGYCTLVIMSSQDDFAIPLKEQQSSLPLTDSQNASSLQSDIGVQSLMKPPHSDKVHFHYPRKSSGHAADTLCSRTGLKNVEDC